MTNRTNFCIRPHAIVLHPNPQITSEKDRHGIKKKKQKENHYCFRRTHNSKSSLPDT